jgi:hypothetical protein
VTVPVAVLDAAPTVYVASKSKYGANWREWRDAWADLGLTVTSTWIDESSEGESADLADLWKRCIAEASAADFLIAWYTPGDEWKGAYVEIGAALASGKPVYVIGPAPGSFKNHPLITLASDPNDAIEDWRAFHFKSEWPGRAAVAVYRASLNQPCPNVECGDFRVGPCSICGNTNAPRRGSGVTPTPEPAP